ncbi:MAG: Gldg family protein, partial [Halieaceae bacterium]|nr:Gldg family protein [Halieaceae bacterium]
IRGYFSERSHPLLAPLVPQLRDLLREYAVAGGAQVRVEFVDPAEDAAAEQEANEDYNIQATPFQVADRYQSALVNAYFDVLIQYGGEYETLGFGDFIEVKTSISGQPEVVLRNPEFDVTRAIRDVLYRYRSGGELFDQIESPVTLRAYVSDDARLPQLLIDYRDAIRGDAQALAGEHPERFSVEFIEPEADDGATARRIYEEWGFQPMIAALGDEQEFYFYLTLEDDHQVIQLPTGRFDEAEFGDALEAGLRRFARGFTRSVALVLPSAQPSMPGMPPSGLVFQTLQQSVSEDHTILMEDLGDGSVDASADLLVVVAPENLGDAERFAIDQYLMRGGTVILATSPWSINTQGASLSLRSVNSGLGAWLEHHGISVGDTVVLDERNAAFPVPVVRRLAGYEFRDMQFVDYPYLLDVRDDGLNREHPITSGLPQLTIGWASPIDVEPVEGRRLTTLLASSDAAWRSADTNVMPSTDASGVSWAPPTAEEREAATVGVLVEGIFESYFDEVPELETAAGAPTGEDEPLEAPSSALTGKSPASARLLLVSSNDFASDQVLSGVIAAAGTQYLGPLEFLLNAVDWALEDSSLTSIRSRAHFNRTLPPLPRETQASIEYGNYALALFILIGLYLGWRVLRVRREARLAEVIA